MAAFGDEDLIAAVQRVRATTGATTAAAVHQTLVAEGHDVSLSQVKKASSKAMKRQADAPVAEPVRSEPVSTATISKKEAKAANRNQSIMKAAETHMMEANRTLRLALGDDEYSAAIATSDRGEKFISRVTQRALEAKLSPAESLCPQQRLAADLATLEWMLLAEKGGNLTLPEDARASAVAQIERLKRVRESPTFTTERAWVSDVFLLPEDDAAAPAAAPPSGIDYAANSSAGSRDAAVGASLDRALAKSGMLGKTVGGGFDDDID